MCPERHRAQQAALSCWRRIVALADLWGRAKAAFTQNSRVLRFFARRREALLQHGACDRSSPSTDRCDEWRARPRGHVYHPPTTVQEREFLNSLSESELRDLFQ